MKLLHSVFALGVLFTICWSTTTPSLLADEPATLSVATAKPPEEVAEPIRASLDDKVLKLSSGGKPFFEFWFRKALPLSTQPADGMLAPETLTEGAVLGVLRVDENRRDFRDEELPKGIYVIRLGLQPEDGNHQGSAPSRTFRPVDSCEARYQARSAATQGTAESCFCHKRGAPPQQFEPATG